MKTIIALLSLWLPLCAYAEVGSCYAKTYNVTFYDSGQEKLGEVTSFIKVTPIDSEKIQFEFQSYGVNFHTCTVPGFALKQKNGNYLFIDRKEFWTLKQWEGYGMGIPGNPLCEIALSFTTDNANISSTGDCRGFCGANMDVRGTQYKASKANVCDKSLL